MSSATRERLARELLNIREAVGVSGAEVARALKWSQSKVSRVENGLYGITPRELNDLLHFYAVPEEIRAELYGIISDDDGVPGMWVTRIGGPQRRGAEVAAIEQRTHHIRQYDSIFVPGQLQSPEYALAISKAGGWDKPLNIAARRMARQEMLEAQTGLHYEAVLDARVFLKSPGDRSVILGQLDYLGRRASLPNITLRIIPLGVSSETVVMTHFSIFSFVRENSPDVAFIEQQTADVYFSDPADVRVYSDLFGALAAEALPVEDSLDYLGDVSRLIKQLPTGKV